MTAPDCPAVTVDGLRLRKAAAHSRPTEHPAAGSVPRPARTPTVGHGHDVSCADLMSRNLYADPCTVCRDDRDCPRHVSWTLRHDLTRGPWWHVGDLGRGFAAGLLCGLAFVGAISVGQAAMCLAHDDELRYCEVTP